LEAPKGPKPAALHKAKQKESKQAQAKQSMLAAHKEEDLGALGGHEKLSIGDVFQSLNTGAEQKGVNTTKLRSQVKTLNKEREGAHQLDANQFHTRKRIRQE